MSRVYYLSGRSKKKIPVALTGISHGKDSSFRSFYLIPGSAELFIRVLDLPPVPKRELANVIQMQIPGIYPGSSQYHEFDFLPFQHEKGWRVVLYILKKQFLDELSRSFPEYQFISAFDIFRHTTQSSSYTAFLFFPDFLEVWQIDENVPSKVTRIPVTNLLNQRVKKILSGDDIRERPHLFFTMDDEQEIVRKSILQDLSDSQESLNGEKTGSWKTFSDCLSSLHVDKRLFMKEEKPFFDKASFVMSIIAFFTSLVLLVSSFLLSGDIGIEKKRVDDELNTLRKEASLVQEELGSIDLLREELTAIKERVPFNPYDLLSSVYAILGSSSKVSSLSVKGKELTIVLQTRDAIAKIEEFNEYFSNVRVSNIRQMENGLESFTLWAEVSR
jgi:hypothetical protein